MENNPHYKSNRKIYRVFKTTLEMLEDRGFIIPSKLTELNFENFIKEY